MGVEGFAGSIGGGSVGRSGQRVLVFAVAMGLWALAGPAAALPSNCSVSDNTLTYTSTFGFTGGSQTWMVPAGVTTATFDVRGAKGGDDFNAGGLGGRATALLAVTPGATVTLLVGGQGGSGSSGAGAGGFNGGAAGTPLPTSGPNTTPKSKTASKTASTTASALRRRLSTGHRRSSKATGAATDSPPAAASRAEQHSGPWRFR